MAFMEKEITKNQTWFKVTGGETVYYPANMFSREDVIKMENPVDPDSQVEEIRGYGARMSAPGYLDCPEWWEVFDSEQAAEEYLDEYYGDDEDEDEDNN